jgi:MFS family permease
VEKETVQEDKKEETLRPLYVRSVVNSLGAGMVGPFMGAYAVELGASSSDMGWFQSSANISNNLMQVFWGRLSDKMKRRIPFIVIGSLIVAMLWIPMMFVTTASQLIILIAFQALLGSMATPAWTALIGDLVPSFRRGRANASINLWAALGGVVATTVSGVIMMNVGGTIQQMFFVPLAVAAICGASSAFVMFSIKEKKNSEKLNLKERFVSDIFGIIAYARKTPDFIRYCYVDGIFEFFMSISWPLFSITQVKILNATLLQIAVLSVVQSLVMIVFQNWAGKRVDIVGRKPILVFFRFSLVTVPLAYALVPDINTLIIVGTFWGFAMALGQIAVTAYLLDVTPEEYRGSFIAMFNLIIGVTTFFGSLIGGYLSDYVTGFFGLAMGLQIVYVISIVGRGVGAAAHLTLKETLKKSK